MNDEEPAAPPSEQKPKRKPIGLALVLAFTPAALALLMFTLTENGLWNNPPTVVFIFGCILSIALCLISSVMLFRRGNAAIVVFTVLLFLLNIFVAFAFGCGAIFTQIRI